MTNVSAIRANESYLVLPTLHSELTQNGGSLSSQPINIRLLQLMGEKQRFAGIQGLIQRSGSDSVVSLMKYLTVSGQDVIQTHRADRRPFTSIVQQVVSKYFAANKDKHILELGAGCPVKSSPSFLSSLFPANLQPCIISTDQDPKAVDTAKKQGFDKYRKLDASRITALFPKGTMDKVIASCFLDTLSRKELKAAFEQIREVLKPGGSFIHFSDIHPYINIFYSHNVSTKTLALPLTDKWGTVIGLQILDIESYKTIRKELSKKVQPIEIQFLDWLASLNIIQKEYILNAIWDYKLSAQISEWFKSFIPQDKIQIISLSAFFQEHIREGLKDSGLQVVEMDYQHEEEFEKDAKEEIQRFGGNHVVYLLPGKAISNVSDLPENVLKHVYKVHVLVVQKPLI